MTKKFFENSVPAMLFAVAVSVFAGGCNEAEPQVSGSAPAEKKQVVLNPITTNETVSEILVQGTTFAAKFSKATGTLDSLIYAGKPVIVDGKGPKLNAFRAIVNNDGWAYRNWFRQGLFDMKHEVLGKPSVVQNADGTLTLSFLVRSQGKNAGELKGDPMIQYGSATNGIPTKIEIGRALGEDDLAFTTQQIWTVYPDGSIELAANITSNKPNFDLPRLGYTLDVPADFKNFVYYGRGPQENYADRESGAFIGIYASPVAKQITNYTKPQEMANHEDVRWCVLADSQGEGVLFIASDGAFSAQALPVTALDLLFASNAFKLEEKVADSTATTLNLDVGVRGLGGASCGPDTEKRDKVFAAPTDFGFIIRPIHSGSDLIKLANVSPAGAVPISVTRNELGVVSVSSKKADAKILVSVNGAPETFYTGTIPFKNGGTISARFENQPGIKTEMSFPKIEKVRTQVVYASSENSGSEAAANLTDGDPSTMWHTAYSVTQADYPHEIDFDIGEVKKIKGVSYLPRQDGGLNGDVKGYEIYVSNDGKTWGKALAKGDFSNDKAEKRVLFASPVDARYIRFRAMSSQTGTIYGAGAEFSVLEN
ncbi:MAG: discoidin domain-containing protein [Opitutales bacterium]|nr:discoidin domain-containing protein [Opitutales bacterium]